MSMIEVRVPELYFRPWLEVGNLAPEACPVVGTPHYRFAVEAIRRLRAGGVVRLPVGTGYGRYTRWERARCLDPRINHTEAGFLDNIRRWLDDRFDAGGNPIPVSRFEVDGVCGYQINDGAHRSAFVAAEAFVDRRPEARSLVAEVISREQWRDVPKAIKGNVEEICPRYL